MLKVAAVALIGLLTAAGCQSTIQTSTRPIPSPSAAAVVPGTAGPPVASPTFTLTPPGPCLGETVTVTGQGFTDEVSRKGTTVTLWLQPPRPASASSGVDRPTYPNGIKLGTAPLDAQGSFTFTFALKDPLGPGRDGSTTTLQAGTAYVLYVESGAAGSSTMRGNRFVPCTK